MEGFWIFIVGLCVIDAAWNVMKIKTRLDKATALTTKRGRRLAKRFR